MYFKQIFALTIGLLLPAASIKTHEQAVSAQEVKSLYSPVLLSQRGGEKRTLRAASGPDDQGRWRFYKPNDVSWDAMEAQGCTHVGTQIPWRCPRDKIRVEVSAQSSSDRYDDRYDRGREEKRTLRAASGPDDQGRWRFYKPHDVSDDAMQAQGCSYVGTEIPWRCPRDKVRVEVDSR
ncbi:hypothetical protein F7734_47875 [Scytonema sp. UIC 10036]|uniref:hypothetical protein n=1 Tax=Scytonema sp. UIC 10036 TaxID=2304196 RepID=UPI0012DA6919|nr:hypothetical protein [Scytonema sp. UIC 10036]MUG99594.1 hypothetical protein [Scytonema sp. UIC 10036]